MYQDSISSLYQFTGSANNTRRSQPKAPDAGAESVRFFDESRVPVEVIDRPNPDLTGLAPDQ